ncbi:class I SAM-dependent methyltransferase [Thalassomonas actiniarum]|uniref:Class I SAM-dependent methyltransferase n=1 Tax=Thalassomonas actiniarum TaxID=485447 RepID=A0AAF0C445_9GAMM|nr:class I SAM-dependent methyltransferase [Thalassomonas actiniarum]WDD99548.1 class I SAM-dependent methyltransferase [Thalassomonas actiniarum]
MIEFITSTNFSECQRLFHGRGHAYENLSHVNVDWLPPVVLITLYQEVEESWLAEQAVALQALIPDCRSVQVQYRCRAMAPGEVLLGEGIEHTQVQELGLSYHIELGKAQNTGLFLDMRNGRQWVKENSKNLNVLNLFAYTCAFSVAALAGGAAKVVNVDVSKASLGKGRDNHRLNRQDTAKVKFEGVDIFKSYGRLKKHGPYDLLICDPPSFQKGSVNIERDYAKIIRRIPQLMKDGGRLMLCLNSPDLDENFLLETVQAECPECRFDSFINPPEVYKEAHQGKGLKVLLFTYLPAS